MCSQTTLRDNHWLVADNTIIAAANHDYRNVFRAQLYHALLFHNNIAVTDSIIVNTPNLRTLLQEKTGILDNLLKDSLIVFKRQADNDVIPSLVEIRDSFLKNGNKYQHWSSDQFERNEDLDFIDSFCTIKPYRIANLGMSFTENVINAFEGGFYAKNKIPDSDRAKIVEALYKLKENYGTITQKHFERDGGIQRFIDTETWLANRDIIFEIERAHYGNSLSSAQSCHPIYPPEHKNRAEIIYENLRNNESSYESYNILNLNGNYLTKENLAKLKPETIRNIRDNKNQLHAKWIEVSNDTRIFSKKEFEEPKKILSEYIKFIEATIKQELGNTALALDGNHKITFYSGINKISQVTGNIAEVLQNNSALSFIGFLIIATGAISGHSIDLKSIISDIDKTIFGAGGVGLAKSSLPFIKDKSVKIEKRTNEKINEIKREQRISRVEAKILKGIEGKNITLYGGK